jgi:hypothetical protein
MCYIQQYRLINHKEDASPTLKCWQVGIILL